MRVPYCKNRLFLLHLRLLFKVPLSLMKKTDARIPLFKSLASAPKPPPPIKAQEKSLHL